MLPWRGGRFVIVILLTALPGPARAQPSLDADLDRAAARYAPAAAATPDDVDRLAGEAAEHYRAGQIDKAVDALDRAAGIAFRSGATGRSFELALTAAEALRAEGRAAESAERFQHAALGNPSDPRAAEAHQTACQTLAAALDDASADQVASYARMLDQHMATWPDSPSADAARWARVELLGRQRRWSELRDAARAVTVEDPHHDRSRGLLVAAHAGLLAEDHADERFERAREDLIPIVFGDPPRWPDTWTPLQREAALTLARGALDRNAEGLEYARRLLRHSLSSPPEPGGDWRRSAAATLVVVSLAAGDTAEAGQWMRVAHNGGEAERQELLNHTHRRLLAHRGVAAEADRLIESLASLAGGAQVASLGSAAALADAGRDADARQTYKRLAAERPDDHGVQVAYARALAQSDDTADRAAALERWRAIESRSDAGSDAWFEARLERLRLMAALGRREPAQKLLALTRLLAPSLGGDARRSGFEAIAAELQRGEAYPKVASP